MKFQFKIQQYQTDAVDAVVQVFNGQRNLGAIDYIRDLGKRLERPPVQADPQMQLSGFEQAQQEDELDPTGFKTRRSNCPMTSCLKTSAPCRRRTTSSSPRRW